MEKRQRVHVRRADSTNCRTKDLYVAPSAGSKVAAGNMTLQWNPKCFSSGKVDVYLYAQQQQSAALPVHAWLSLPASQGSYDVQLLPQWWNATDSVPMNLQFVPSGSQAWETPYPLSSSFTVTNPSGSASQGQSIGSQYVTDLDPSAGQISHGGLAAAIVVPAVVVLGLLAAAFLWLRKRAHKREEERRENSMRYSQYAGTHSGGEMTQAASSVPPMSVYNMNHYQMDEPAFLPEHAEQHHGHTPSPLIESSYDLAPVAKEHDDSIDDTQSGPSNGEMEATVDEESEPEQRVVPRSRSSTRLHYAGLPRGPARRSMLEPDFWFENTQDSLDMDSIPSTREEAEKQLQSRSRRPPSQRLSVRDVGPRPRSRSRRRTIELEEAPEPASPAALAPAIQRSVPPTMLQYTTQGPPRESFTFVDDSNQRRVSSNMLGTHTRDEKVSAYLSQLPSFDESPGSELYVPPVSEGRTSRRQSQAAPSVRTARSRPVSMEGTMFHDAFDDDA